jgi:Protein of unknown function (DUF2637)
MNVHFPASQRTWPGRLLNLAVVIVVLAIAADTFVLSYPGVHAIVLQAGVSARLARVYPGLFDALFVVACVAAITLRGARWWARCYAWLVIVVVVAVVGATDAVHAMNITLPHRTIEGVVAAAPWVIVLLGFSLMLAMLRQSRVQHAAAAKALPAAPAREAREASGALELPWSQEPAPLREAPALPQAALVPEPAEEFSANGAGTFEPDPADGLDANAATLEPDPADGLDADAGTLEADAPAAEPVPAPAAPEPIAAPEAGAVATEPVSAPAPAPAPAVGGVQAAEPAEEQAEERELAEEPSAAADPESLPNGHEGPVTEEQNGDGVAAFSVLDLWKHDTDEESADAGGSGHPATVPSQVLDDEDAPPFATAPFATVPRLNRVRSTPTPPEDDDEDE